MKILITQVGHPNFRGGGNTVAHELSSELQERGHKVKTIFISPPNLYSEKPKTNYGAIFLKQSKIPLLNCFRLGRLIKKLFVLGEGADIILSLGYEGFFIPRVKKNAVFISASHNYIQPISPKDFFKLYWIFPWNWGRLLYTFQRLLDKQTKISADFVQALCEFSKKQCVEIYGIPENKIFTIPNGVRVFGSESLPVDKTLLFMGGSSYHKGLDLLIEAMPKVLEKHPDAKLLVLGEMKKEEMELRSLVQKKGILKSFSWRGLVGRNEAQDFLKKTRIAIFPSRLDTFPLGILESMACGIPVIATRVGGIPEIVKDGKTGILIPKEDVNALSRAIVQFLSNSELIISMGREAKKIAEEKFGWDKVAQGFEKEFEKIAKSYQQNS